MTNRNTEALKAFFEYAAKYLGREVRSITIIENGEVVPKFDELTTEYTAYSHLFEYWGMLNRG